MNNVPILVLGFVTHVIFIIAVYDVYFTTTSVSGMTPHRSRVSPTARRLVLLTLDGARAASVFQLDDNGKPYMPFLRKIIETKGAWGISSNPGTTYTEEAHIAMVSGRYQGLVEEIQRRFGSGEPFDTVFNESRHTWAMGHVPLFPIFGLQGGFPKAKVTDDCHKYFYNCTKPFFESSKENRNLKRQLSENQIIFFINNLYVDGLGHDITQGSRRFKHAMRMVDDQLRRFTEMIEEYYGDKRTVFVVTSDHGQVEEGFHGTNTELERFTPLIVWGAGVRGPLRNDATHVYSDSFSKDWKLSHIRRHDIQMIDIAPLVSALLGVNFPMNSEGILPHELLNMSLEMKAEIMYAHVKQLLFLMGRKMEVARNHSLLFFSKYSELTPYDVHDLFVRMLMLISENKYQQIVDECARLAPIAVKGIRYYQAYNRFFLRSVIVLGFIGWIVYMLTLLADDRNESRQLDGRLRKLVLAVCGIAYIYIYAVSLRWPVYIYCSTTICIWLLVVLRSSLRIWKRLAAFLWRSNKISILCYTEWLALILSIVLGCTDRYLLTFGFLVVGVGPLWSRGAKPDRLLKTWLATCITVAVFPNVPAIMFPPDNLHRSFLLVSGALVCLTGLAFIWYTGKLKNGGWYGRSNKINLTQVVILAVATFIAGTTRYMHSHQGDNNFTPIQYAMCWLIMGCTPLWPLLENGDIHRQVCTVLLSVFTAALLISKSWDSLYFAFLVYLLVTWFCLDTRLDDGAVLSTSDSGHKQIIESVRRSSKGVIHDETGRLHKQLMDIRRVVYTIFFAFASFFGRDTIQSITGLTRMNGHFCLSYDTNTPQGYFLTGLQVIIPVILVLCVLNAISRQNQFSSQHFLCTAYIICDIMSMMFLFMFYDVDHRYGWVSSWAHYTLSAVGVPIGALLLGLVRLLMSPKTLALVCRRKT